MCVWYEGYLWLANIGFWAENLVLPILSENKWKNDSKKEDPRKKH
jgi:hypothetical protein